MFLRTRPKGWDVLFSDPLRSIIIASVFFAALSMIMPAFGAETVADRYPGLAAGVLQSARLVDMGPGVLLSADGFEIPRVWIDETVRRFPPESRKEIAGNLFFLLEQAVTQKAIVRDAVIAGIPSDGRSEEQIIQSYLAEKVSRITASDAEVKSFYDTNTQMVGGRPLDQVKESIRGFLIQQKRQEAVFDYIDNLKGLKDIRIDGRWTEKQYPAAMDNPVDRARRSGKPSMVEFGATGCVPCDMMQPILARLRKHHLDRLNVVFVNVRQAQILGSRFGIRSIPVQVFYDRTGEEVFRHVGFFAEADVNKQLKKMGF